MGLTDNYVKKQLVYQVIQYTGDNSSEVSQFLADRNCNQYISCPDGDLSGIPDGPPLWVTEGMYLVLNMATGWIAETPLNLDSYEIQA